MSQVSYPTLPALKPATQALVEVIREQLERTNPTMLEALVEIIELNERTKRENLGEAESELFIAGALIMHEMLRQAHADKDTVKPITVGTVRALYRKMNQKNGIRIAIAEAETMLLRDSNDLCIKTLLNTFMTIKKALDPSKNHNLRSHFAKGCKLMYWLWYTQAHSGNL